MSSELNEKKVHEMIVIGSGPAGYSAALYAARAELNPLLFTGTVLGGQAALTHIIENYPGFPDGIGGAELGDLFMKQAEKFGTEIVYDTITEVDFKQQPLEVKTYTDTFYAKSVIVATGASPNKLGVDGEEAFTGKGVSYCATCDGWFFKEKKVIVVGGGDSALEEAIYLTRHASEVTIIHRRDELRAGAILQKRAMQNEKINFIYDTVVEEIKGDEKVDGVLLKNVKTGEVSEFEADGVFIFIGHTPNTQMFAGQVDMDEQNYLKTDISLTTNVSGVFVAGEVADPHFRQVVSSAGMGAAAAIQATRYIESLDED